MFAKWYSGDMLQALWQTVMCYYLPLRRWHGMGDVATLPVRLSVRPSRFFFALSLEIALMYFLETL